MDYKDVLGPGGLAAARMDRYEARSEQLKMAESVEEAIQNQHHLIVEAGTGVGKSFAYLVPAILYATADQNMPDFFSEELPSRKVVISTHTIALQEQLYEKDIPFLASIFPFEFSSVLMKGRGNYLCRRRAESAYRRAPTLFAEDSEVKELDRIFKWIKETSDGSKSDLDPQPNYAVWDEVCCEQGNCMGHSCPYYKKCFYQAARRRVERASVIVVNHALLFSDLAVRSAGGSILPNYDVLIFDEAHTMEQAAGDHLGLTISQGQIEYLLNRLWNDRNLKGLLADSEDHTQSSDGLQSFHNPALENAFNNAREWVDESKRRAEKLFESLREWFVLHPNSNGRIKDPGLVNHSLEEALLHLSSELYEAIGCISDQERKTELTSARQRVMEIKSSLTSWIDQEDSEMVYWLEKYERGRVYTVKMKAAPVNVGRILREHLFSKIKTVVMTSATLATESVNNIGNSEKNPFSYFQSRIGVTSVPSILLGSPFNYTEQVTLVIPKFLENIQNDQFGDKTFSETLMRYIKETEGGAFILFTSYSLMNRMAAALTSRLIQLDYPLLTQGKGIPRSRMVEEFQKNRHSVLLGTDSFWQGVNVPGDALRNVIITQLPFAVPTHPLIEARTEAITLAGGNFFYEYTLPQAVIKMKQGFGRLIRTAEDSGIVVITDIRIIKKSYGKVFLRALPDCKYRSDRS